MVCGAIQLGETLSASLTPHIGALLNIFEWQLREPDPNDEDLLPPHEGEAPEPPPSASFSWPNPQREASMEVSGHRPPHLSKIKFDLVRPK